MSAASEFLRILARAHGSGPDSRALQRLRAAFLQERASSTQADSDYLNAIEKSLTDFKPAPSELIRLQLRANDLIEEEVASNGHCFFTAVGISSIDFPPDHANLLRFGYVNALVLS